MAALPLPEPWFSRSLLGSRYLLQADSEAFIVEERTPWTSQLTLQSLGALLLR